MATTPTNHDGGPPFERAGLGSMPSSFVAHECASCDVRHTSAGPQRHALSARRWRGRVGQRPTGGCIWFTPEPHREVELAVLVLATAECARDRPAEWTPREPRHRTATFWRAT